jgi:hypothetical protein
VKTITAVPESITRDQYLDLMRAVGFTPEGLKSLEFRPDGIYAVVIAQDDKGHDIIDKGRHEIVTHKIFIPVDNSPVPADWNAPPVTSVPSDLR